MPAAPSQTKPGGDERSHPGENRVALTSEEKLHLFWKNNGRTVMACCAIIVVAILARGGWDLYSAQREQSVEAAYAAATTPEQLSAFAAGHPDHVLAGIALLRLADDAYAGGKYADAQEDYGKAAAALKTGPFAARARLGAAMSLIGQGKTSEGEEALNRISADAAQLKVIRAEATYHLASLAAEAGRTSDVAKRCDDLMQIDPSSPWTQRALALRSSMPATPVETKPAAVPAAAMPPLISLPSAGK